MATRTPQLDLHRLSKNNKPVVETPPTLRRYTPYTKSYQRSRVVSGTPLPSQQKKQPSRRDTSKEASEDLSSVIVGKTWIVHRASPFSRLNLDRNSLHKYERGLDVWLSSECSTREYRNEKINTSFRKVDGDSVGEYGVEIKIYSSKRNPLEKDSPDLVAVLYCGPINEEIIIPEVRDENWKVSSIASISSELISLPVVLIKSSVILKEKLLQWLEGQFGCKISPLLFSPMDLAWLVSLCSGIGEPLHPTELTYRVPAVVPELDTICFNIVAKDAKLIWDAVHDSTTDFFSKDEASKFLKSLESHFYHHFKIHLDQMQLTTVGTSLAYIGGEGRVKILQRKYVCYILQQFTQLADLSFPKSLM